MLDQPNKVMMNSGQFVLNRDIGISTQKENMQSSENYAKMMILGIVDSNVAGFVDVLQNQVNEGRGDDFISEALQKELKTYFDKINEVNRQAEAVSSDAKQKIDIKYLIPTGYKLINPIMNSLINNNLSIKEALDQLNTKIQESRQKSYIDVYTQADVNRIQLIYSDQNGDHIINKNYDPNIQTDGINSIDAIPGATGEQKDLLKQLCAQGNWAPYSYQSLINFDTDKMPKSLSGSTAKIIQTEEGGLKLVLFYGNTLMQEANPPVSLTKIEVDLSNARGNGIVNLASAIDLAVSAKTYYFDPKLQVSGCTLEKADDHSPETLKEFCDILQKRTVHHSNTRVAENTISQEEANQEILNSLTKHLEYFKCLYYGQNDKLKSLDLVINNIQQNGDLTHGQKLICEANNSCNISLEKIDNLSNINLNLAESIHKIIKQNQGRQNYSTLLQQVEQSTIDNLDILCTDDNQREILEKNAKQFARICLYELGELKFGQHPLECIIMLINKFFDYIMEDKMEEIMVGSKTENAKSFVKMIEERRNNQNNELHVH